jgi:hypothetical protein
MSRTCGTRGSCENSIVGKLEGKILLGKRKCEGEDNIKIYMK